MMTVSTVQFQVKLDNHLSRIGCMEVFLGGVLKGREEIRSTNNEQEKKEGEDRILSLAN